MAGPICFTCGYDLRGVPADKELVGPVCPECGNVFDLSADADRRRAEEQKRISALRRDRWLVPLGLGLAAVTVSVALAVLIAKGSQVMLSVLLIPMSAIVNGLATTRAWSAADALPSAQARLRGPMTGAIAGVLAGALTAVAVILSAFLVLAVVH